MGIPCYELTTWWQYRRELKQAYAERAEPAGWGGPELAELRKVKWERLFSHAMKSAGKTREDARNDPKSAKWKVRVARKLRRNSAATNGWIAGHLPWHTRPASAIS